MAWGKREAVTNLVMLGDEEGHKKTVGGLLIGCPRDRMYDKVNYQIVKQDGEEIILSGSSSLNRQINEGDIGKFIKCEFKGWGKSANGKFKDIEVNVWEGEPTEKMKAWPRYAEFATPTQTQKKAAQNGAKAAVPAAAPADDFADFPPALEDDTDDLPF
jgi:hypothetical protein